MAKKRPPQTGSTSANFHEASRSEYLAHFVFSSLGTSVPIPRPEDTGLDLYCTLTKRIGQRIWPQAYYSVQVKSNMDNWTFEGHNSVRWLIEHPLPLFLCVVLKREGLIRVYQTTPRFSAWSLPPLPQRLELIPGHGVDGRAAEWIDGTKFNLSAPILEANVQETLQDEFVEKAKNVLQYWIDIDLENLDRLRNGVLNFKVPHPYRTGECIPEAWSVQGMNRAKREAVDVGIAKLKTSLDWVSDQLYKQGDLPGAIRGMLLLRHLYWCDEYFPMALNNGDQIGQLLGKNPVGWVNQIVDEFGSELDSRLIRDLRDATKLIGVRRLYLGGSPLTERDIECLSHATGLRYLFLARTGVTDQGLQHLKTLTNLRELNLNDNPIVGSGLAHLKELSQLETLSLSGTKATDKNLRHLKGLACLENLNLNYTPLTSKSVTYLKGLPRLEFLSLNGTAVDDAVFKNLREYKSLRRLDVVGTKVTHAGIEEFKRARSDIAVLPSEINIPGVPLNDIGTPKTRHPG